MDLDTLSIRNMVEDHEVATKYKPTDLQVADMGTKALAEGLFTLFRDVMNGYALVRAAHPSYPMSDMVYKGNASKVTSALTVMQVKVMRMNWSAKE